MKTQMNAEPLPFEAEIEPERYELFEDAPYSFEADRRRFLASVGAGLAVFVLANRVDGQQPQQPPRRGRGMGGAPQEIGAWLHIGEDGTVTAFTGKVEIGQNIRTSLAQVIAEELHLPPSAVKLVMADTELTPPDAGTFGSQTTPQMASQLRRAAASAREALIDLAAEEAKLERAGFTVADGKIVHKEANRSFAYADLAKGKKLTKTVRADAATTAPKDWKVAGTSVPKAEGRAIVTGKHRYSSDIRREGMLHGKVLRPATLGATLVSADLKEAQAQSGVTVVRDGDFIGAVAANPDLAEAALRLVKAEWTPGPQASDATLFADLKKPAGEGGGGQGFGGRGGEGGDQGSIEDGLAKADHKLAATYTIAYIAHAPLEPRAAVAEWTDGKLTVWTGTQTPFRIRGDLAAAFGLPQEKVRVIVPDTGSGYGGKHTTAAATEAARLAKAAGKPVRLVFTREEEFTWAYFRPAGVIEVNAGATKDGTLTAWEFHNYNSGGSAIRPLYEIPYKKTQYHPSRSPLKQGSYRGLAATANHFARESHMDDLAKAVGIDPLEFRLKNLKDKRLRAVLEAAAEKFGWGKAKPEEGHGFGIAGGFEKNSYVATCAEVQVEKPGGKVRVLRLVSAFDCGAVLNPDHLKNQIEGAMVQGLGGALFEAIKFDQGKITNAGFSKYRVPRFSDLPALDVVLVDRKDVPSAGAGETPIVGVAPAVGNAIFQGTGIRVRSLPMAPQGVKA